ncbi:site-specific integrase [Bradyrhizobium sp. Tv2a-2]|uniref:tyrosine-type recombinase/integrase n=1 Tax=Bradyrhizobium sp. Tv2a-2 TaxID=113395 RepID=UPI00056531DF|nr:site-specific integrase [Bradyrhizobium sp. Tv2a-2]
MSKQPKAPKGCYWRDGVLWGRIQAGGRDYRWSLRTDDPKTATKRREVERDRVVAAQYYGDHRRTLSEATEAWGRFIVNKIGPKTFNRYLSSLAVLQPHLEGLYLDEIDKKLIGSIVESRQNTPYVPKGKKHPITVKPATIKRDLTALSSVFDFCVDEEWISTNPAMDWLKPGHRKKSRLQERRDPIVLPEAGHVEMVIAKAPGLFADMIRAAVMTGARLDELAKGARRHFDNERKQLTVVGKRNKMRVVDLVDGEEDFGFRLFSSLPASLDTKALFWYRPPKGLREEGAPAARPYSQVSSNFRRIVAIVAKQAQKQAQDFHPFRFHDLRHLHAVNWLKSGRSIYVLQQRLGHTSVKTTEMYLAFLTAEEKHRVMFGRSEAGTKTGTQAAV